MTIGEAMKEVAGAYSGFGEVLGWCVLGGVILGLVIAILRSERKNR